MLTKQDKIDAIYEKIARKDLAFWCTIESVYGRNIFITNRDRGITKVFRKNFRTTSFLERHIPFKIIGHPVMIGDVMEYFYDISYKLPYDDFSEFIYSLIKDYKYGFRLPLEEQSDECINFIYNLISE